MTRPDMAYQVGETTMMNTVDGLAMLRDLQAKPWDIETETEIPGRLLGDSEDELEDDEFLDDDEDDDLDDEDDEFFDDDEEEFFDEDDDEDDLLDDEDDDDL